MQPGPQPPVVDENLGAEMRAAYRHSGIFAHEDPVRRVVERIEALDPAWVHAMHGGTLTKDALPRYSQASRDHDFAYAGVLLGRDIDAHARAGGMRA